MIGLSLSFCVCDIADGKIEESAVDCIISGTKFRDEGQFYTILDRYSEMYWKEYPKGAQDIARRLVREGKIYQPRLCGLGAPNISQGHWVSSFGEIQFCSEEGPCLGP